MCRDQTLHIFSLIKFVIFYTNSKTHQKSSHNKKLYNLIKGDCMNQFTLERRNLNLKPRILREVGFIPGNIYGKKKEGSIPVKIPYLDFANVLNQTGEIYTISFEGEEFFGKIQAYQRDPVSNKIIHFSICPILNKSKPISLDIPIKLIGERSNNPLTGVVIQKKDSIRVSGELANFPDLVNVDVSRLKVGDSVLLSELKLKNISVQESKPDEVIAVCRPSGAMLENYLLENSSSDLAQSETV